MGANPRDDENLTAQQHLAFKCIVRDLDHICVDFAVWGPHGDRMLKQRCFIGLGFGPDSNLMKLEIRGPPTPKHWYKCYRVFRVGAISHKLLSPVRLDAYATKIMEYAEKYPRCWALIYQAEFRT